jgi:hypothetical protein
MGRGKDRFKQLLKMLPEYSVLPALISLNHQPDKLLLE